MSIRLRAHHLLCMLTYVGRGYTPGFTANYDRIAARIVTGEVVELVSGPDDICAPLLSTDDAHCHRDSVIERDRLAAISVGALLGQKLAPGDHITPHADIIARMRKAFSDGSIRTACHACEWADLCTRVSHSNYPGVKITPP
jgi:hypothetical protein